MYTMVILLCLNAVPRDQCDEHAAVWVMKPVITYENPEGCAVASMQMLPIIDDMDDQTHPRIECGVKR